MGDQQRNDVPMGIWKAIFEFAQNVGAGDPVNVNQSSYERMSEENRKWLEKALNQYAAQTDPVRQMKEHLKTLIALDLHNPVTEERQRGLDALEAIKDLCEDIDNASDFHKIGGFRILIPLLGSSYVKFRSGAAELIGHLSQNHPYCQEKLSECKILKVVMELMDKDSDDVVKLKALYAVSCLVRSNERMQKELVDLDGLSYLMRALTIRNDRMRTKASFLLMDIFQKKNEYRSLAAGMGMVDQLVAALNDSGSVTREHVTSALLALVTDCPNAIEECQRPNLALKDILTQRIQEISEKPDSSENDEELNNCKELLNVCWPKK